MSAAANQRVAPSLRTTLPIQVVTGFLGAGKTTLIKRLLASRPPESRVAVVVNEFGTVPFDGVVLRAAASAAASATAAAPVIYDLPGGCICCTQAEELQRTLMLLATRTAGAPPASADWIDRIVIEASGAATGALLTQLFELPTDALPITLELAPTVTVVDCATVLDRLIWDLYVLQQQIKMADVVVLNREQAISAARRAEVIAAVQKLNPAAVLVAEPAEVDAWAAICVPRFPRSRVDLAATALGDPDAHAHLHAELMAIELDLPADASAETLARRLEAIARDPACGAVLRAKALLRCGALAAGASGSPAQATAVELTAGRAFIQPLGAANQPAAAEHPFGRLVVIGKNLVLATLESRLRSLADDEGR